MAAGDESQRDAALGFTRPEMNSQRPLAGSWKEKTDRMLFIVLGKASEWPEDVKDLPKESLFHKVKAAVSGAELEGSTRILLAEGTECDREGDVLVFPGAARFHVGSDGPGPLVAALKSNNLPLADVEDVNVFVCAHQRRDERCGHCGPALIDAIKEQEISARVRKCSHVGGHIYAGNLVVFPDSQSGDFYGYVTPSNVKLVVAGWLRKSALWRGGLFLTPDMASKMRKRHVLVTQIIPLLAIGVVAVGSIWRMKRVAK